MNSDKDDGLRIFTGGLDMIERIYIGIKSALSSD